MKIYLDVVFFLNFCYDFLILMTIDITLKRHVPLRKIFMGGLLGAFSLGLLFIPLPSILLFLLKIIVSIGMILITFHFKDIKSFFSNVLYLYMVSITLGGFLYFLNVEFSYKKEGLVFYFEGLSINYILLIIIAPFILFLYIYEHKKMKSTYNLNYEVTIYFKDDNRLVCNGFIDSGNRLKDPITRKYVLLIKQAKIPEFIHNKDPIYVPFKALNKTGLVKCYPIKYIKINNQIFNNYLVGIAENKLELEGIDCILNYKLMEELCLEN